VILRRLTENLKQQNWTAIGIELVIVVLGVFIGMQVSNWNEQQAEARLGKDYVRRLIRDLTEDHDSIRMQVDYYGDVLKSTLRTDELLSAANPDPRELVVNAYRATEVAYTAPVRATWDQIVASGHLGLLPAQVVESGLLKYYAFDTAQDIYGRGVGSTYRETVRKLIPLSVQIAIRAGCSDVRDDSGAIVAFEKQCNLDVDPATLKAVAAALRSDPAVAADLRYQYSFAVSAQLNLNAVSASIEDALTALGAGQKAAVEASP
jgi:hypothetical protein